MERDMELVRGLLLTVAANHLLDGSRMYVFRPDDFPDRSAEQIDYHVDLLIEAGFFDGNAKSDKPMVSKLTWKGHEFVDSIRDQGIWNGVKKRLEGLPSVALSVVAELALNETKRHLGLK